MKKVSLILIVCFLFAAVGVNTASAQSSQTGYIPLLTQGYDTSAQRVIHSSDAYQTMLPHLIQAKAKGVISNFTPDLFGGFVQVTYPNDMSTSSLQGLPVYGNVQDATIAPVISSPQMRIDSYVPRVFVFLYSSCVWVDQLNPGDHVKATVTVLGKTVGYANGYAGQDGGFYNCMTGSAPKVVPNAVIKVSIYNSANVLLKTISGTATNVIIATVDKTNAIARGTGPAGKPFKAFWSQPDLDNDGSWTNVTKSGTIPSTGVINVDFGTLKLRGGSHIWFQAILNANLFVERHVYVPSIHCTLGTNNCYTTNIPNTAVSISITRNGVTYRSSGKTDPEGFYYAVFYDANLNPINLTTSDVIAATGCTSYRPVALTAKINSSVDTVTGTAPASKYFYVNVTPYQSDQTTIYVHANSAGAYTANFSGIVDIPDTFVSSQTMYQDITTGNETIYQVDKGF